MADMVEKAASTTPSGEKSLDLGPPFDEIRFSAENYSGSESITSITSADGLSTNVATPPTHSTQPNQVSPIQTQQPDPQHASDPFPSLPTIHTINHSTFLVRDDIPRFLEHDLSLARLNAIHTHLWMCGRPMRARPLQRYLMEGYDLLYTERMDLHLLRFDEKLMIRVLPEYMLSTTFWTAYLCTNTSWHASATGFLLSYIWLIPTALDFRIAQSHSLIPSSLTWATWLAFATSFARHIDLNALDGVNKRWNFGDLRLGRINTIYRIRFFYTHFTRGYLFNYNRYSIFWRRRFAWWVVVWGVCSLVLGAMQVGTAIDPIQRNEAFTRTSYGFVVFSMASVAFVVVSLGLVYAIMFFSNMVAALRQDWGIRVKREGLVRRRVTEA